jgi:hypothetical protein
MKVSFDRFVVIFVLLFAVNTGYAAENLEKTEEAITSKPLTLTEAYTLANTLPKKLIDLSEQLEDLADTNVIFTKIQKLSSRVGELEWETTTASTNPNLNAQEILFLDTKLVKISVRIAKLNRRIESNIHALEILSNEWLANDTQLQKFITQTGAQAKLTDSLPTADSLVLIIKKAQQLIEEQIQPTLLAGKKIGEIQARVYTLNNTMDDLLQEMNAFGFQQN